MELFIALNFGMMLPSKPFLIFHPPTDVGLFTPADQPGFAVSPRQFARNVTALVHCSWARVGVLSSCCCPQSANNCRLVATPECDPGGSAVVVRALGDAL